MRSKRLALELGMKLAPHEVGMVRKLHHLDQIELGVMAREHQAALGELGAVGVVHLVAMAVALADVLLAVELRRERARLKRALVSAKAHGAALVLDIDLALQERD